MQDYRKDEIIYDEDWQQFDKPAQAEIVESNEKITEEQQPNVKRDKRPISLITIQLVLCLVVIFVLFILKSMDSDVYQKITDWYESKMKITLVSTKTFEDIDLKKYFPSTCDEFGSTIDEN